MNKSRKNRNQKVIIKIWLKERDKQFWGKVLGFKIQKKKKRRIWRKRGPLKNNE